MWFETHVTPAPRLPAWVFENLSREGAGYGGVDWHEIDRKTRKVWDYHMHAWIANKGPGAAPTENLGP